MANEPLQKGAATLWPEEGNQAPVNVYVHAPKNKQIDAKWLILWQEDSGVNLSLLELVQNNMLTLIEWRVLGWIMCHIGIGNRVTVNQSEMCRRLKIYKANACNAVKRLVELGILLKGQKAGRSNTYTISPAFGFAGSLFEGKKQRKALIKPVKPKGKKA